MRGLIGAGLGGVFLLAFVGVSFVTGASEKGGTEKDIPFPEIPRVTKEELKAMLEKGKVTLIDVRIEEQWRTSDQKLPGAVHEHPFEAKVWAAKYSKDEPLILY